MSIYFESLAGLPLVADDVWEGGLLKMPQCFQTESSEAWAPWLGLWVSRRGRSASPPMMSEGPDKVFSVAVEALAGLAHAEEGVGYLPGRIEVNDSALAEYLQGGLDGLGVEVVVAERLPMFEQIADGLLDVLPGGPPLPGILSGRGVSQDQVRAFAEAAAAFDAAAPWRYLANEDLLVIESPKAPQGMRYAVVLGEGHQEFGLGFYHAKKDLWEMMLAQDPLTWIEQRKQGVWNLTYADADEASPQDVFLWQALDLPRVGDGLYPMPVLIQAGAPSGRPSARRLDFLTGLLRALAQTTEQQVDSGRWTVPAEVGGISESYTLSLPDLLKPPGFGEWMKRGIEPDRRATEQSTAVMQRFIDQQEVDSVDELNALLNQQFMGKAADPTQAPPRNALESAQDLCYRAFDTRGRRQIQLAREALSVSPDCADAYVILAERESDPMQAMALYEQAVAAGRRALADGSFEPIEGAFWGRLETRPFMRALLGLGDMLSAAGRPEDAVVPYHELLRINPNDNQGVRYRLLPLLMSFGNDREAAGLLKQYADEESASWTYHRALVAYRLSGDSASARRELIVAIETNPHLIDLLDRDDLPWSPPSAYRPGSPEEALICLGEMESVLQATPGAREWLCRRGAVLRRSGASQPQRKYKQRKRRSR
ncbi:MAG: hypothetical protein AAF098_18045 [Pseudomonadota bacterium]